MNLRNNTFDAPNQTAQSMVRLVSRGLRQLQVWKCQVFESRRQIVVEGRLPAEDIVDIHREKGRGVAADCIQVRGRHGGCNIQWSVQKIG